MAHGESKPLQGSDKPEPWTRRDYLLTVMAFLVKFGDSVEIYLPGVITQQVSCELDVSTVREGILAVILYLCWGIATMLSVPISTKFGDRFTLLLSLYLSIISTVLCAVVPNYYTFLLSRALIGVCGGLNSSSLVTFLAKAMSSKDALNKSFFLASGIGMTLGGTWISIMGYLLLELMNWRNFVLLTSIPLFVPPIVMIHFCSIDDVVKEENVNSPEATREDPESNTINSSSDATDEADKVPNVALRVFKSSLFSFSNVCLGYGGIIFVPWVIRSFNIDNIKDVISDRCSVAVQGTEFFILTIATGATNIVGRVIGYQLWYRIGFLPQQATITAVMAVCFGATLAEPGFILTMILLGLVKLCYSIQAVELSMLYADYDYYGKSAFRIGTSVTIAAALLGSTVGTSVAAFLDTYSTLMVYLVISLVHLANVIFMSERR